MTTEPLKYDSVWPWHCLSCGEWVRTVACLRCSLDPSPEAYALEEREAEKKKTEPEPVCWRCEKSPPVFNNGLCEPCDTEYYGRSWAEYTNWKKSG